MAGNAHSATRPKAAQDRLKIAAGSPLAVQGIFIEIMRERFRVDSGLSWTWREDITETDILIEAGYNEETESRSQTPAIYINRLQTVPSKVMVGDRVGVNLPDHLEGFGAITTVTIQMDCVSNDEGSSAIIGDITQHMLLASQDVIQREFGLYDFSHPHLGQTTPYDRDQTKWNSPVSFEVQFWIRWSQVPIAPLLQQISLRVSAGNIDAAGFFVDSTINSMRRGDLLTEEEIPDGTELPPSRVSIVGPQGPAGPVGPAGPPGAGFDFFIHETLDTLTHNVAETSFVDNTYVGSLITSSITWTSVLMTSKIRESTFTYVGPLLTGAVTVQYAANGITPVSTLTKTLAYLGSLLTTVTVVKT